MIESDRFHRWVNASFVTARFENFMPITVQGLGRLDHDLVTGDARFLALSEEQCASETESLALNYRITLSYLWVLGAYEVVRTIDQRCREQDPSLASATSKAILALKRQFERLRIPLAKFEPANRHRETDSKVAYPALNLDYGIAWQVVADTFIPRKVLSDSFLEFLEGLRNSSASA